MIRKTLTFENREISYEYRLNRALIILCLLPDNKLTAFADMLNQASQIETVSEIKRYDSGLAIVIARLKFGYDTKTADKEIEETFNQLNHAKPLRNREVQALPQ